jgi:hypothetical protein
MTAAFTLLGGIIGVLGKGYYDLAVEREKSASGLEIERTKVEADIKLEQEKFESSRKSERQKLDEDLIKLPLQSPEIDKRKEALSFMVETGLIADSDIKQGVENYLAQKKPGARLGDDSSWALPGLTAARREISNPTPC